jgi:hypothetical protein
MSRWKWIEYQGHRLKDLGVAADGSIYDPNRYGEELVRAAVAQAEEKRHQRRREAALRAAQTRARRREKLVHEVARAIVAGRTFGPRQRCVCCLKALADPESIERGIGSDCWQGVLSLIEHGERAP